MLGNRQVISGIQRYQRQQRNKQIFVVCGILLAAILMCFKIWGWI